MRWADVTTDPTTGTLRQFAGILVVILGVLSVRQYLVEDGQGAAWFGVGSIAIAVLGAICPRAFKPMFIGLMVLVFPIAWTWSIIILAVLFFGLITPIALIFRLIGRDALAREIQPESPSYWIESTPNNDPARYLRQY